VDRVLLREHEARVHDHSISAWVGHNGRLVGTAPGDVHVRPVQVLRDSYRIHPQTRWAPSCSGLRAAQLHCLVVCPAGLAPLWYLQGISSIAS
jgi:hypothetical protein